LDHETFEKLQSFLPSCSLTCIYVVATTWYIFLWIFL
jgi:hypothetical protein